MTLESRFHKELEHHSGKKLDLKINDNRSTMVSVKWKPNCTRVSLHHMFLQAPPHIMRSLACFIKGKDKIIGKDVKNYIEINLQKLNYSHLLDSEKLCTKGIVYDLQKIYDELNREYFHNQLKLNITWFGKPNPKPSQRVTFGLYHSPLKLIKINRLLDSPAFPDYVVSFVVFHEMAHEVCPSYHDEKGIHRIHSKEFKEQEAMFRHYHLAKEWIKEHRGHLFKGMF